MATLGAPVRVSPLIKTVRWGALITGLLYGTVHYNTLSKRETAYRAEEAKLAEIRAVEMAAAKEIATKVEMEGLARQIGIKTD